MLLTHDKLIGNLITLFSAGLDTSSITMIMCLMIMCLCEIAVNNNDTGGLQEQLTTTECCGDSYALWHQSRRTYITPPLFAIFDG